MKYCNLPSLLALSIVFCDSFPFPHYFTLCTTSAASNTNTHITHARMKTQFCHSCDKFFHDYYICRKTWNFFFMTDAYAEKLGNFKELIICMIRYIKYLVEKQGCKSWILNPISLNHSLCFVLLWCVCLTLWHYFVL